MIFFKIFYLRLVFNIKRTNVLQIIKYSVQINHINQPKILFIKTFQTLEILQQRQKLNLQNKLIIKINNKRSMSQNQRKKNFSKQKFSRYQQKIVDASHQDNFIFNKTPILASALRKLKAKSSKLPSSTSQPKPMKRSQPINIQEEKQHQTTKKVKRNIEDFVPTLSYTPLQRDLYNFFIINKTSLKNFQAVPEPKFQVGSTVLSALCDRGIGGKFLVSNIFRNKKCYIDYKQVSLFTNQKKNQQVLQKYTQAGQYVIGTVVKGINPNHIQLSLSSFISIDQKQIKVGQTFPAQIKSKQQLGCLLIVYGVKNFKIFLPKSFVSDQQYNQLQQDKQIIVVVKQIQAPKKIIKVSLVSDQQLPINFKGLEEAELSKMQLDQYVTPGTLINTKIVKVLTNGVMVKFLKVFFGFIHIDHLNKHLESYSINQKILARVIFYCINPPMIFLSEKHVDLSSYQPKHQLYEQIKKPHGLQQRQGSFFSRQEQIFVHPSQVDQVNLSVLSKLYVKQNNYFERYQIMSSKKIGICVGQVGKIIPFTNFKVYGENQKKQGNKFRVMCLDQWNKVIKISYDEKIVNAHQDSLLYDVDQVNQSKKYTGFISNVNPNGVVIQFCNNIKGILSKSQLKLAQIEITEANIGESFDTYVSRVKKGYIGLTLKSPQMRNSGKSSAKNIQNKKAEETQNGQSVQMGTIQSINPKSIYPIYIKMKNNKFAKISIFTGIRAPSLIQSHIVSNLQQHYKLGQNVRVFRKGKNYYLYPPEQMKDPQLRYCKIIGIKGSHLRVQTGDQEFKNCHITNITDIIAPYPLSQFKIGQYTIGRVISDNQICLRYSIVQHGIPKSMQQCVTRYGEAEKQGDLRNRLLTIGSSALKTDMVCFGYIKFFSQQKGCFISLSHNYEVRVQRCQISDTFIKDKQKYFKTNKLVLCRLISTKVRNNQPSKVFFDATLRESVIKYGYPLNDEVLEHGVGLTVEGTIKGYTKGKALVTLHSSKFTGIIDVKDIEGIQDQSIQKALPIGKTFTFKIIQYSFDGQKRLIRLSNLQKIFQKYKKFQTKFEADQRVVKLIETFNELSQFQPPEQINEINTKQIQINEKDQQQRIMNMLALGQMQQQQDVQRSQQGSRQVQQQELDRLRDVEGQQMDSEEVEGEQQDLEGDQQEQVQQANKMQVQDQQHDKKATKKKNKQDLQEFHQKTAMFQKMPHPPSFYHSLVLANPTPQSWLMYISSLLNTSTPEEIRVQFLKAIHSFSEIKDKDNMWISWINIELILGDLMGTVKKAIESNVGANVYFRVLEILIQRQQWDVAIQFGRKMLKKFNRDIKAYTQFLKMIHQYQTSNNGKINESISQKQILRRASQCLKSHEVITIESHIAKHLFESNQQEQGRNMFEQLLAKHPRRTDLWSMYIDLQLKSSELNKGRNLFQRVLSLPLNKKQTKSILKKYYLVEKENGNEKTANAILERAKKLAEEFVGNEENEIEEEQ